MTATYEFDYAVQRVRDAIHCSLEEGDKRLLTDALKWLNEVEAAYKADTSPKPVTEADLQLYHAHIERQNHSQPIGEQAELTHGDADLNNMTPEQQKEWFEEVGEIEL